MVLLQKKIVSVNFLKTREKMLSSRIKKRMDIEEFESLSRKVIYQEAKKAVDIAEKDYLDTVKPA